MNRALFTRILVLAALPCGPAGSAPAEDAVPVTRGPSVQMTTRQSAVLVWRTVGPTIPAVRYGTTPEALDQTVLPVEMTIRVSPEQDAPPDLPRLSAALENTFQYEARLSALAEDTVYYYGIFDGDELLAGGSQDYHFRTPPPPHASRPLRFWVVGDTGDGGVTQKEVFDAAMEYVEEDGRPLDAFFHLGDMAYESGLDHEFQANFFDVYAPLLRNTVIWPTMGNHEGWSSNGVTGIGAYYDAYVLPKDGEAGGVPSGYEGFYSFDLGPIHFVCLNSHDEERSTVGRMATWLKQDLAQNDSAWLVAFWHHPPYSKGTHNSDTLDELIEMREIMMPILEDHGLDLVLTGHSHVYERSMLLDRAYATPTTADGVILDDGDGDPRGDGAYRKSAHLHPHEGTVAVVAGHGRGAARFGLSPVHRRSIVEAGSVLLDLEGDTMTVRMLNSLGEIRDEFQIIKRGQVVPLAPVIHPWNLFGPAIVTAHREIGETEVHLFPQPPAHDAVVYYTLDGSDPTPASAVYTGPITLRDPTTVKAINVWRGGQRTSPVATGSIAQSGATAFSRTIRIPLLASEDDASESDLGMVDLAGRSIGIDSALGIQLFGLRFRDVPIGRNATILSAALQLSPHVPGVDAAEWTIHGDLSAPSPPFSPGNLDLSARPRSAGVVGWSPVPWSGIFLQNQFTPEMAGLVEELVHRPGWQRGEAMTFLLSGTGDRQALSVDNSPSSAPVLFIAFDERDPVTVAADVTPVAELEITPDGTRQLFFSFPQLLSAQQRGLRYLIEGSPVLTPGPWESVGLTFDRFLPSPGPGWGVARYRVVRPGGLAPGEAYFLRVRVLAQ